VRLGLLPQFPDDQAHPDPRPRVIESLDSMASTDSSPKPSHGFVSAVFFCFALFLLLLRLGYLSRTALAPHAVAAEGTPEELAWKATPAARKAYLVTFGTSSRLRPPLTRGSTSRRASCNSAGPGDGAHCAGNQRARQKITAPTQPFSQ